MKKILLFVFPFALLFMAVSMNLFFAGTNTTGNAKKLDYIETLYQIDSLRRDLEAHPDKKRALRAAKWLAKVPTQLHSTEVLTEMNKVYDKALILLYENTD